MNSENSFTSEKISIREPYEVMKLDRMGAAFPTRISFMRRLIRQMKREKWKIEKKINSLDSNGFGYMLYVVTTPFRSYSLVCFSHSIKPEQRTDRVIANEWDATFTLYDGIPDQGDINRLADNTPKQEAGRFQSTELVISRANKSMRLFENIIDVLSQGNQPKPDTINRVGYLMRTTAVYANGKFGLCDRFHYADRLELSPPFQAEMLTVYLIRLFTFDLVDHIAFNRNPPLATKLDRRLKRHLGIGNATGLGMAPFLISHPILIHNWFYAREVALQKIRSIKTISPFELMCFRNLAMKAEQHVKEWNVEDEIQAANIANLVRELNELIEWTENEKLISYVNPWNFLYLNAMNSFSIEGQELLLSLLLEPYPEIVDSIGESLEVNHEEFFNSCMTVDDTKNIIDRYYQWALVINFNDPKESYHFWYYSKEKLEPRRGIRNQEPGADKEMQIAIARDVQSFRKKLDTINGKESLATFVMKYNEYRHIALRVQIGAKYKYAEIQDNVISDTCRPINILRGKLAFFGASKFDPKSDLWTRITMYQGAPLSDEINRNDADDWCFPVKPVINQCKSH